MNAHDQIARSHLKGWTKSAHGTLYGIAVALVKSIEHLSDGDKASDYIRNDWSPRNDSIEKLESLLIEERQNLIDQLR